MSACHDQQQKNSSVSSSIFIKLRDAIQIESNWSTENSVVVHSISEPDNLHPTNGNSAPRNELLLLTQRTLLYSDYENASMIPGLLTQLPIETDNGLQYLYSLKHGPMWDDGSTLRREDILFTAKVFSCPLVNDPMVKTYWNNLKEIIFDQTDTMKFTCVMNNKNIQNKFWFGSFPILEQKFHDPASVLSKFTLSQFGDSTIDLKRFPELVKWADEFNDDSNGRSLSKLNGLGMYKVTNWETGQYLTLEKKKNHWTDQSTDYHERSFPNKIIYKINKDDQTQQLEFKNQNYDVTSNISVNSFLALNQDEEFRKNYDATMSPTYNYTYIGLNERPDNSESHPFFVDIKTRKAIAHLIDVSKFTQLVYNNYAGQCKRMVSNVSPFKKDFNDQLKPVEINIENAKKLLLESGWNDNDKNGVLEKNVNGKIVEFRVQLNYLNTSPDWRDMALLITEELKKVAIVVEPVPMELKLFLEKARNHDFDMLMGSWSMTALPEDFTQLWHSKSWSSHGSNYCGFGNETSDKLIEAIKSEIDLDKRMRLSKELQQLIYDDQPFIFLYTSLKRSIIHKRFGNRFLFADRPGILLNPLRLLSITPVITLSNGVSP